MIQYAAAFVLEHARPGVLDSVEPGDDRCGLDYES